MLTTTVRPAQPSDLPALARLWYDKTVLQQQADSRLRLAPGAEARWQAAAAGWMASADSALLVALAGADLAGYVLVQVQDGLPGLLPERLGVIRDLTLDTHRYHGGLGRELVDAARGWLRERDVDQLSVWAAANSAVEQAFWRSLGAREWMDMLWITS